MFLEERACALNRERLPPSHGLQVFAETSNVGVQLFGQAFQVGDVINDSDQVVLGPHVASFFFTQVRA